MDDELERSIERAGRLRDIDAETSARLRELVAETAGRPRSAPRRRSRRVAVGAVVTGAFVTMGASAVAASQLGLWQLVAEPDVVVAREWTDAEGTPLGACESRMGMSGLDDDQRDLVRDHLDRMDLDALEPDPWLVAEMLTLADRRDDFSRLVPGGDVDDQLITVSADPEYPDASDARILQDALMLSVFGALVDDVDGIDPALVGALSSTIETQCDVDAIEGS